MKWKRPIIKNYITLWFIASAFLLGAAQCTKTEEETYIVEKEPVIDKSYFPENVLPVLNEAQERTFRYFWDESTEAGIVQGTGLAAEGSQRHNVVTIGGAGFGVMATIAGVERGWISRDQGIERLQLGLDFLTNKAVRFGGIWPHWINPNTGSDNMFNSTKGGVKKPSDDMVESCFMLSALLMAREYYDANTPAEIEIRETINEIYAAVDWKLYTNGQNQLHWIYFPENENGEVEYTLPIRGWNEALICYVLALGAPNTNVDVSIYDGWRGSMKNVHNAYGYSLNLRPTKGGPMFLSHYSMLGLNPTKMEDDLTNYWQHVTTHAMVNRHHCVYEAPSNFKYNEGTWGLTACYGGTNGYSARNPNNDDGTIAPTAALGSYPYVPFYATQYLINTISKHPKAYGKYGFVDAYNPENNWYEDRHLAIDQGPIVVMMENYRSGLFYDLLMKCPEIQTGLTKMGISEPNYKTGFHLAIPDVKTTYYDAMMHPDLGKYQIDFYLEKASNISFYLEDIADKKTIELVTNQPYQQGSNQLEFSWKENIIPGKKYTLYMNTDNQEYTLKVILH